MGVGRYIVAGRNKSKARGHAVDMLQLSARRRSCVTTHTVKDRSASASYLKECPVQGSALPRLATSGMRVRLCHVTSWLAFASMYTPALDHSLYDDVLSWGYQLPSEMPTATLDTGHRRQPRLIWFGYFADRRPCRGRNSPSGGRSVTQEEDIRVPAKR